MTQIETDIRQRFPAPARRIYSTLGEAEDFLFMALTVVPAASAQA